MPEENESPSVGWRAVYHEMGVSTVTDPDKWNIDDYSNIDNYSQSQMATSDVQVLADDE